MSLNDNYVKQLSLNRIPKVEQYYLTSFRWAFSDFLWMERFVDARNICTIVKCLYSCRSYSYSYNKNSELARWYSSVSDTCRAPARACNCVTFIILSRAPYARHREYGISLRLYLQFAYVKVYIDKAWHHGMWTRRARACTCIRVRVRVHVCVRARGLPAYFGILIARGRPSSLSLLASSLPNPLCLVSPRSSILLTPRPALPRTLHRASAPRANPPSLSLGQVPSSSRPRGLHLDVENPR